MKSIMVVEDDPEQAELMLKILSGQRREVQAFSYPLGALAALSSKRADLLIADLSLPWIDGREVITRARQQCPDLPIFLVSGYQRGAVIAQETGVRFFRKPLLLDEFLDAVDRTLEAKPAAGAVEGAA